MPSDSLCVHANLLPTHLEMDKHCNRAALQLATLPADHPLTKLFKRCNGGKVRRRKAPTPPPGRRTPRRPNEARNRKKPSTFGQMHPFKVDIPKDKDSSKKVDASTPEHVKIYTDCSAHNGKVGAVAILTQGGKTIEALHHHLGSADEHTAFEAELAQILLGLQLIKACKEGNKSFAIGVDNQAAIKALSSELDKLGRH